MDQQRAGQVPAQEAARPLAALCFVLLATLALLLPVFGGTAWAELAAARRASDSRLDPGLLRLSPLLLPSPEHLRKAQSLKLQPKKWLTGGGDAALPPAEGLTLPAQRTGAPVFVAGAPGPGAKPLKTHPPRAPPAILFPL